MGPIFRLREVVVPVVGGLRRDIAVVRGVLVFRLEVLPVVGEQFLEVQHLAGDAPHRAGVVEEVVLGGPWVPRPQAVGELLGRAVAVGAFDLGEAHLHLPRPDVHLPLEVGVALLKGVGVRSRLFGFLGFARSGSAAPAAREGHA